MESDSKEGRVTRHTAPKKRKPQPPQPPHSERSYFNVCVAIRREYEEDFIAAVEAKGMTRSEWVREAISEKLGREVLSEHEKRVKRKGRGWNRNG